MKSSIKALFFVSLLALAFLSPQFLKSQSVKQFTLVIDPGHGGKQPGAVSGTILEKDLNLAIALRFGRLVESGQEDVKVLYTRDVDREMDLSARGAFANRNKADLFVSIHINALSNPAASGTSTWIMGVEKNKQGLAEAMRENEVIKYEEGGAAAYEGFDPGSAESYIIFQIMQYAHFERSLQFARLVQRHYARNTPMRDRGAEQGPFLVLWKAAMPSVLTEVGFISNAGDRAYISSEKGQREIAESLYDAFCEYRTLLKPADTEALKPAVDPAVARTAQPAGGEGIYHVQLFVSRDPIPPRDAAHKTYKGQTVERQIGGWYKYSIGPFGTMPEAVSARDDARRNGFPDAFITK